MIGKSEKAESAKIGEDTLDKWWGKCRVCGETIEGSQEELRKHVKSHGKTTDPDNPSVPSGR